MHRLKRLPALVRVLWSPTGSVLWSAAFVSYQLAARYGAWRLSESIAWRSLWCESGGGVVVR